MGGALTRMMGLTPAAGGGGPTSTKWRLYFPAGSSLENPITTIVAVNLSEVEMRATSGGADQCSGGTASASTEFSGSFLAANAFDNNNSSQWSTTVAGNDNSWLEYDFASAVSVNEVTVRAAGNSGPTAIQVQYWDGAAWVTYIEDAGPLTWGSPEIKTLTYTAPYAPPGYDRWRIFVVQGSAGSETRVLEIQMRNVSGGADRCFGGVASASSALGTRPATNAFNNDNTGNGWVPNPTSPGDNEWLEWQFWRPEQIVEFTVAAHNVSPATTPRRMKLQHYNGSTWVDDYDTGTLSWSASEVKTFTI